MKAKTMMKRPSSGKSWPWSVQWFKTEKGVGKISHQDACPVCGRNRFNLLSTAYGHLRITGSDL